MQLLINAISKLLSPGGAGRCAPPCTPESGGVSPKTGGALGCREVRFAYMRCWEVRTSTHPNAPLLIEGCYTCAEWATQSATRVGSSLLDSLTVPSTHFVPKIVFAFSPICRACENSIAIYLIIMQDFIFLCIGPHHQSAVSYGCCWRQAAERNQPRNGTSAMSWAFHMLQKICRIKIS